MLDLWIGLEEARSSAGLEYGPEDNILYCRLR